MERNPTQLLPAAPAGTDRRVPNGIQMGDRMEAQKLEQDGRTNELAKEKSMSMETDANWSTSR